MTATDTGSSPATRLDDDLARHRLIETAELEKALVGALTPPGLTQWFNALADDRDALERLSAASSWHPIGFAKIVLHSSPVCSLRLHVWPTVAPQVGDAEPHSHRWDFASTVLAGQLTVVEFEESDEGLWFRRCSYNGKTVLDGDPVRLRQTRAYMVAAGDRYVTSRHVIHKVHPVPCGLVASLLLHGPRRSETTAVYRITDDMPASHPIDVCVVGHMLKELVRTSSRESAELFPSIPRPRSTRQL